MHYNDDYKASGVDIEAGYKSVALLKKYVKDTMRDEVIGELGGFSGMFSIAAAKGMDEPILVSGTDGVGTKLRIASVMDRHDTVGIDCVAMCVNDIICCGAEPLFFLDYIACGKNIPEKTAEIVKGICKGCRSAGVSLIGGETAEMPGFYETNEYDLAGFTVGIVDKAKIIDGSSISPGDVLIGIASNGLHSNGYSLVRKTLRPSKLNINEYIHSISAYLGDELLKPTKIYVKSILELLNSVDVKGLCHITGGGFIENIPRMIPAGMKAVIKCGTWNVFPIFEFLESMGNLDKMGMYNTFNMGIGMVAAVSSSDVEKTVKLLDGLNEQAYVIGEIARGKGIEKGIEICLE